jgi:hypothetical protein
MKVRGRLTNRGELIAEVAIEGFKPFRMETISGSD